MSMEDKILYKRIMERNGRLFYSAPCMLVIPVDSKQYAPALIDCGILCQNITLIAIPLRIANMMCGFNGLAFASGLRAEEFSKRLGFPRITPRSIYGMAKPPETAKAALVLSQRRFYDTDIFG